MKQLLIILILFLQLSLAAQTHHPYVSEQVWQMVEPYLLPDDHPIRIKLDKIFEKDRALKNLKSLEEAGFHRREPWSHTRAIVIRHKRMPGYIFKLYTDDKKEYYRNEPEYVTWMLRARGAKLVRDEIQKQGWEAYFKAPNKWIYPLPPKPKASSKHLQKNFILVEDEMDLLPDAEIRAKWKNGTITTSHLDMLFHLVTATGMRGGCKYDNIPICKDGRIAFIDTQNNQKWPLPYARLFDVLEGELSSHWANLISSVK